MDPRAFSRFGGVLKTAQGGIYFDTQIVDGPPPVAKNSSQQAKPIGTILLYAFLGGLILNLMPCVFPVIRIKIMGFVNQAGEARQKVVAHGVVFPWCAYLLLGASRMF